MSGINILWVLEKQWNVIKLIKPITTPTAPTSTKYSILLWIQWNVSPKKKKNRNRHS